LENFGLRVGVRYQSDNIETDSSLKIKQLNTTDDKKLDWSLSNKTLYTKGKFTFGSLAVFNLCSNVLSKSDLLFGYKVNDNLELFLRAENSEFREKNISYHKFYEYF
jgi:hypothetical protein